MKDMSGVPPFPVPLLGKVERKTWYFFFIAVGEGGCSSTISQGGRSSTTLQGGNYGMLGSDIISTSSLIE
jgi:hypothetical protein